MGHRVSANLFRVGRLRNWNSQWFAKSEYTYLISLDFRVRDFMDYIFYNLKWPCSELQIKRFLSRTVILEIIVFIPEDSLVSYLRSIHFIGMQAISNNIDLFKFNSFALDSNYIFWNFACNILNKSIFFLLLRTIKLQQWYDLFVVCSVYKRLFYISDIRYKNKLSTRVFVNKSVILYQFHYKVNLLARLINYFLKYGGKPLQFEGTLYFLRNILNTISVTSNKLYLGIFEWYLFFLKEIIKIRRLFIQNFKNKVKYIYSNINTFLCSYDRFDTYNRLSKYYNYSKKMCYPYDLINSKNNKNIKNIKNIKNSNNINNGKNTIRNIKIGADVRDIIKYNSIEQKRLFTTSNKIISNVNTSFYTSTFDNFIRAEYPTNKFVQNKYYNNKYYNNKFIQDKYTNKFTQDKYTNKFIQNRQNNKKFIQKKQSNIKFIQNKLHNNRIKIFKKKLNSFTSAIKLSNKKKYILNTSRIPYRIFKRSIFFWLLNTIHSKMEYNYLEKNMNTVNNLYLDLSKCIINGYKLILSRKPLLLRKLSIHHKVAQKSFSPKLPYRSHYTLRYKSRHKLLHRSLRKLRSNLRCKRIFKSVFLHNLYKSFKLKRMYNNTNIIKILKFPKYNSDLIHISVRFFFFSNVIWYLDFGAYYFQKLLLLIKNKKIMYFNAFYKIYNNISNLLLLHKFVDFFNFLKFENSIFTSIKFLRYYKKFFLNINKVWMKSMNMFKLISFLLYIYYYINSRYVYIQLFLRNFLNSILYMTSNCVENSNYQLQICIYLFIYYFFNHLRLINLVVRVLQIVTIFHISCKLLYTMMRCVPNPMTDIHTQYISLSLLYFKIMSKYIMNNNTFKIKSRYTGNFIWSNINLYYKIYKNIYIMSTLQTTILNVFNIYISCLDNIYNFNITTNLLYLSIFKMVPNFIKCPYFIIERKMQLGIVYKNILSGKKYFKCLPRSVASTQYNKLLLYRTKFFFRYVVDKLIFYFDDLRRDYVPIKTLQLFSSMIEYNLYSYLKNKVFYLPIYYLGKRLPIKQAKMVCLYISYELEKGMPYFLILKQISWYHNYQSGKSKKYYFNNFNNIFNNGIFELDKYLIYNSKHEFTRYRLDLQSVSILKYYLFRTFRSIGLFRGFTRKLGMRIACSGRMYKRHTRSHTMWFIKGALPLRTFDKFIDYYSSYAITRLGTLGIKTWIYLAQFSSLEN